MLPSREPGAVLVLDHRDDVPLPAAGRPGVDALRCAEKQVQLVEVVHHQVDGSSPVWAGSWIHSPQSAGNESRYALTARGRPISPAETRRVDLDVLGEEPDDLGHHERPAARRGRPQDRLGVRLGQRQWLLEQDVLAGGERPLGGVAVERCRQTDVDRVDLRIGEHRLEVVDEGRADRGRDLLPALARARADGLDVRAAAQGRVAVRVGRAHEAGAEDRNGDHQCSFRKSCCLALNSSGISQNGAWPMRGHTRRTALRHPLLDQVGVVRRRQRVTIPDREVRRRRDLAETVEGVVGDAGLGLVTERLDALGMRVLEHLAVPARRTSPAGRCSARP